MLTATVKRDTGRATPAAMMWTWWLLAALGVTAHPALAAEEAASARAWLDKIVDAALHLSYKGTFIYRRDDQLVAMRIIHVADGRSERERLTALSGRQREIIRDADGTVCILPEQKQVKLNNVGLNKHFPPRPLQNLTEIEKYYRFALVAGKDRIAGRTARMVVIEPRDRYRYGYRIWIDEGSGLLLQSDLVDENGNAVEQVMFTELNIVTNVTPAMSSAVVVTDEMRKAMAKKSAAPKATNATLSWSVTQAPAGFKLAEQYRHRSRAGAPVEHGVLTDGMASVSVFVEPLEDAQQSFEGVSHMGAVSAFGAVRNDRQLTVVGEVPVGTVQLIGRAIVFRDAGVVVDK